MSEEVKSKSFVELWDSNLSNICASISKGEAEHKKVIDNVWCFSGFSGGNGVSTLVGNIAYILGNKGLKVLIIDLNLTCPIHWVHTKLEYGLKHKDLCDLVLGSAELKDTILNGNKVSLLGCRTRSTSELNNLETPVVGENFDKILGNLKGLYDVILIDCPYGSHTSMLSNIALYTCDKCYMVFSDFFSNINNYSRVIDSFRLFGIGIGKMRYIYNKRGSTYINENLFKELGIPSFMGVLPYDSSVVECCLEGKYYIESGSSLSDNATIFYERLLSLTDLMLKEGGYELQKSELEELLSYLGKVSPVKNNKVSTGLFSRKGKSKKAKDTGIDDKLIDEVTGVDIELDDEGTDVINFD